MAGITLADAEAHLADAQSALTKARHGNYSIASGSSSRSVTRNVKELSDEVKYWDEKVQKLSRGGISIKGGTPV